MKHQPLRRPALDWFNIGTNYPILLFFRALIVAVVGFLTASVTERRILRLVAG